MNEHRCHETKICCCSMSALEPEDTCPIHGYDYIPRCFCGRFCSGSRDMRRLIRNSIQTPDGTILESKHRHDYRTHMDENGKFYMVDGGLDYCRCSYNGDEKDMCLYDDAPHDVQRTILAWGTYGKGRNEPLHFILIKDMETDHILSVLSECSPRSVIKSCMEKELLYREQ